MQYKGYKEGDIFIWKTRGHVDNPLQCGYLYYDEKDQDWYVGDENGYPYETGVPADYVFKYGIKVSTVIELTDRTAN